MDRLLNPRQAGFLRNFALARLDPRRQKDCAEKAGYASSSALLCTNRLLKRKDVGLAISEAMKRAGITIDYMARKAGALMEAVHPNPKYSQGGIRSADNDVQLRALEFAAHIADLMPSHKIDVTEERHVFLTVEDLGRIHEAEAVTEAEIVDDELDRPLEEEPLIAKDDLDAPL
jgi:hypothetical protein